MVQRGVARRTSPSGICSLDQGRLCSDTSRLDPRVARGLRSARARFFGRDTISLLLVLPIALPGIITGVALNSTFQWAGIDLSIWTIIIGHTTFCIVVVYNNVIARLRRTSGHAALKPPPIWAPSTTQTFRFITLPLIATALVSGGLLAFALSFDEVIVTTFTAGAQNTLPIWIFGAIRLGQQLPEVNVVVTGVVVLMFIPIMIAARLTGRDTIAPGARERVLN